MQLLVTAKHMQQLDRVAITRCSIPGLILMENAGRAFVDELEKRVGSLDGRSVVIVAGKGNNGGDGFVIARHLVNRGSDVTVAMLAKQREIKGDAKANLVALQKMIRVKVPGLRIVETMSSRAMRTLPEAEIVIDAVFGTGFSGEVRGGAGEALAWINRQKGFVAAVDMPSGVDASTGTVANLAVRARLTVTMGLPKIGHYVGEGRDCSGEVSVVDISIPRHLFTPPSEPVFRVLTEDIRSVLPRRPASAHKYSVGKVFVLAGSRGFTGAPFMTAQAAMRSGAGAVILGVPESIRAVLARKLTEVMITPLPETPAGTIGMRALDLVRQKIDWADVVAIGPGLSRHDETTRVVLSVLADSEKPVIVDADGLNALSGSISALKKRKAPTILTPHVGELSRLIGKDGSVLERERVDEARAASTKLNAVLVLKGSPTVTADRSGSVFVNSTGNPGMATAGAGDVLTGLVAGLLAQGMGPTEASYAAVFVHGLAGDLAAALFGERSVLALDILEQVPSSLKQIEMG